MIPPGRFSRTKSGTIGCMIKGLASLPWVQGAPRAGAGIGDRQLAPRSGGQAEDELQLSCVYLHSLSHGEAHSTTVHCDSTLVTVTVLDGPHLTQ